MAICLSKLRKKINYFQANNQTSKKVLLQITRIEVTDSCPDFRDRILAYDFPDQNKAFSDFGNQNLAFPNFRGQDDPYPS